MHHSNNPQNLRAYQLVRQESQPNRYQECQFAKGCQEKAIKGHLIPESHLKRLQPNSGKVVVSGRYARALGNLRQQFPTVSVGDATVGYFTCIEHDQSLVDFDCFTSLDESADGRIAGILDNLYLRGLMHHRWWMQLHAQTAPGAGAIITQDKPDNAWLSEFLSAVEIDNHKRNASNLLDIQRQIERCSIRNKSSGRGVGHSSMLVHTAFKAAAEPHIVAYQLGVTLQAPSQPVKNLLPIQTALIALEDGYVFAISSTPEYKSLAPRCILGQSDENTARTSSRITRAILRNCETLVFSKAYWDSLPDETRQQIVAAHTDPTPSTPITVDLLAGTRWEALPTR